MDELSNSFSYNLTFLLIRSYNPDSNTKCKSAIAQKLKDFFLTSVLLLIRTFELLHCVLESVWAFTLSLVATEGISVDLFSSGY